MARVTTAPVTVSLPGLKLLSESNLREHWAQRHRRAKPQRSLVFYSLMAEVPRTLAATRPLTIIITRVAPRLLDAGIGGSGNLSSAGKAVQDGIADWLAGQYGRGQDRQPGVTWQYAQRRGAPHQYAVEITFAWSEA